MVCDEGSSLIRLCAQILDDEIVFAVEETEEVQPELLSMLNLNIQEETNEEIETDGARDSPEFDTLPDKTTLNDDINECIQDANSIPFDKPLTNGEPRSDVEIQIQFDTDSNTDVMDKMSISIGINLIYL